LNASAVRVLVHQKPLTIICKGSGGSTCDFALFTAPEVFGGTSSVMAHDEDQGAPAGCTGSLLSDAAQGTIRKRAGARIKLRLNSVGEALLKASRGPFAYKTCGTIANPSGEHALIQGVLGLLEK
jgi:hypothetical protein